MKRALEMLRMGMKPVFVFDGGRAPQKDATNAAYSVGAGEIWVFFFWCQISRFKFAGSLNSGKAF
jgi:hypothetical protein